MSSSPLRAVPVEPTRLSALNVIALLAEQPDPRRGQGRRYPLAVILATVLAALLSGAKCILATS